MTELTPVRQSDGSWKLESATPENIPEPRVLVGYSQAEASFEQMFADGEHAGLRRLLKKLFEKRFGAVDYPRSRFRGWFTGQDVMDFVAVAGVLFLHGLATDEETQDLIWAARFALDAIESLDLEELSEDQAWAGPDFDWLQYVMERYPQEWEGIWDFVDMDGLIKDVKKSLFREWWTPNSGPTIKFYER